MSVGSDPEAERRPAGRPARELEGVARRRARRRAVLLPPRSRPQARARRSCRPAARRPSGRTRARARPRPPPAGRDGPGRRRAPPRRPGLQLGRNRVDYLPVARGTADERHELAARNAAHGVHRAARVACAHVALGPRAARARPRGRAVPRAARARDRPARRADPASLAPPARRGSSGCRPRDGARTASRRAPNGRFARSASAPSTPRSAAQIRVTSSPAPAVETAPSARWRSTVPPPRSSTNGARPAPESSRLRGRRVRLACDHSHPAVDTPDNASSSPSRRPRRARRAQPCAAVRGVARTRDRRPAGAGAPVESRMRSRSPTAATAPGGGGSACSSRGLPMPSVNEPNRRIGWDGPQPSPEARTAIAARWPATARAAVRAARASSGPERAGGRAERIGQHARPWPPGRHLDGGERRWEARRRPPPRRRSAASGRTGSRSGPRRRLDDHGRDPPASLPGVPERSGRSLEVHARDGDRLALRAPGELVEMDEPPGADADRRRASRSTGRAIAIRSSASSSSRPSSTRPASTGLSSARRRRWGRSPTRRSARREARRLPPRTPPSPSTPWSGAPATKSHCGSRRARRGRLRSPSSSCRRRRRRRAP